jgi:glutamyl-tRNA reductase
VARVCRRRDPSGASATHRSGRSIARPSGDPVDRQSIGRLASFLAQYQGVETSEVACKLYVYRDDQVAQWLVETAAGMHSLVLGVAEIQGQIRKALERALTGGTAG